MTAKVGDGDRKVGLDRGTLDTPDHTATMCHCEPPAGRCGNLALPGWFEKEMPWTEEPGRVDCRVAPLLAMTKYSFMMM